MGRAIALERDIGSTDAAGGRLKSLLQPSCGDVMHQELRNVELGSDEIDKIKISTIDIHLSTRLTPHTLSCNSYIYADSVLGHLSESEISVKSCPMSTPRPRKALVIGAGPVGSLTAICLHRRGWEVEVWESREGES